jgi:predicted TPR repeat methyltransferase
MSDAPKVQQLSADELRLRFEKACELHEEGNQQEALSIYRELLQFIPQSPIIHFNMGLARFDLGDFEEAAKHYNIAGQESPEDPDIHYNRGLNLRRLSKYREAITTFSQAIAMGDKSIDTLYNIALCHQDLDEFENAASLYEVILKNYEDHQSSLNNYAYLCHKTGDLKKAEQLYKRLLQLNPQHTAASHMLNALLGITPDNAPLDYIESIFDGYASNFEENLLKELHYRTPTELFHFYSKQFSEPENHKCLDLGCGTGLAGEAFSSICSELTGVDISNEIIKVAEEKNLYKRLVKNDILTFLNRSKETFDLIIAADVFTYMGDLEPLFRACYQQINADGILCFSVEESHGDSFTLKETGRFGHSSDYIENIGEKTDWTMLASKHTKLRKDKNEWILGYLFVLQRNELAKT